MTRQTEAEGHAKLRERMKLWGGEREDIAPAGADPEFFIVACPERRGLFFVGGRTRGGIELMGRAICREAAEALAAMLNRDEPGFSDMCEHFELKARLSQSLRRVLPYALVAEAADTLARSKPWTACHKPGPDDDDDLPF